MWFTRCVELSRATKGAPVTVEAVHVPDPGPGEALVAVQACGVCHTDLHYREGGIGDQFPYLLGLVVLNWRAVCGRCRARRRGEPWYCFETQTPPSP